jgi:hypothetical protein
MTWVCQAGVEFANLTTVMITNKTTSVVMHDALHLSLYHPVVQVIHIDPRASRIFIGNFMLYFTHGHAGLSIKRIVPNASNDLDQEPVDRPCLFETIALHG